MAKKKESGQHPFAEKVSAILEHHKIPESHRDHLGNPFIADKHLSKIPLTIKPTLYVDGHHRICLRSYKQ